MDILLQFFLSKEEGQTLAEYAILLVLIALVVIVGVTIFGQDVFNLYNDFLIAAFGG
jgi:Flp pilus assembly pilin Flp